MTKPTSSWRPGPGAGTKDSPVSVSTPRSSEISKKSKKASKKSSVALDTSPISAPIKTTILGKRKADDADIDVAEADEVGPVAATTSTTETVTSPKAAQDGSLASLTALPPKPDLLTLPLHSQRFKRGSKNLLFPPELLPAYPLPPLPLIPDPELRAKVFTHESLFGKSQGKFEESEGTSEGHYEKLEHVGDSILGMVVTTWLHEVHPRLTCGSATKLRAHLVSNATLSHLSTMYQLPQQLRGPPGALPALRASTDVRAAMMEAYIAAIYFSFPLAERSVKALPLIAPWLREMYEPLLEYFYDHMKMESQLHGRFGGIDLQGNPVALSEEEMSRVDVQSEGMLALLRMYCQEQSRRLEFVEECLQTPVGLLWQIKCLVDGVDMGEAVRSSKKAAKKVVAYEAAKKLRIVASLSV